MAQRLRELGAEEAPRGKTGKLAQAIARHHPEKLQWEVSEDGVPYGVYVRKGTKPHLIGPRYKKALYWPGAAHPVKLVHHPGTKPNPYHERAWQRGQPEIERQAQELGVRIETEIVS